MPLQGYFVRVQHRSFFTGLLLTTILVSAAVALSAYLMPSLQSQSGWLLGCVAFFVVLSAVIYVTALAAARSENPARLAQYVMVLTFVKMALSIAAVYAYYLLAKPESRSFLLPFFLAYFGFTIFETMWLVRMNKAAAERTRGKL